MIAETDIARVRRWPRARNHRDVDDGSTLIRYEMEVDARSVTIVECNEGWGSEPVRFSIARLRYTKVRCEWRIYWRDRRHRFHAWPMMGATANIELLLAEIDRDPLRFFEGDIGRSSRDERPGNCHPDRRDSEDDNTAWAPHRHLSIARSSGPEGLVH